MYSFPSFEPVCCSTSGSNCCFLSCIQVLQEADKVVWYSHFFKTFPQFALIHTVKGFSVVNDASRCFSGIPVLFLIQRTLPIWSLVPLPFLNPACTSGSSLFTYCWSLAWRILSITLLAYEMSAITWWFEHSLALPLSGIGMKAVHVSSDLLIFLKQSEVLALSFLCIFWHKWKC